MARFLLVLILLIAVALLARQAVRRLLATPMGRQLAALWRALDAAPTARRDSPSSPSAGARPQAGHELERCPGCGVYVPRASLSGSGSERRCVRCLASEPG